MTTLFDILKYILVYLDWGMRWLSSDEKAIKVVEQNYWLLWQAFLSPAVVIGDVLDLLSVLILMIQIKEEFRQIFIYDIILGVEA